MTMQLVMEASAARRGQTLDPAVLEAQGIQIVEHFDQQSDAFFTSGWLLDEALGRETYRRYRRPVTELEEEVPVVNGEFQDERANI